MKLFLALISINFFLYINIQAQSEESTHINFILFVDDILVDKSKISNELLIIEYEKTNNPDTLKIEYTLGEIIISKKDYEQLKLGVNFTLQIEFLQVCPVVRRYTYKIYYNINWLICGNLVVRIYNYDNKRNRKYFKEKDGYGVELSIGSNGTMLPRKKIPFFLKGCD
jgi:hypothetical protein